MAIILAGLVLQGTIAVGADVPRHPPVILKQFVFMNATLLLDPLDVEMLSYLAIQQINNITYNIENITWHQHLIETLRTAAILADRGDPLSAIEILKNSLNDLNNSQLSLLAEKAPTYVPACPTVINYNGANAVFYEVANPWGYPSYQDCQAPTTALTLESPLDTLVTLLTLRKTPNLLSVITIVVPGSQSLSKIYTPNYIAELVHIPKQLASKEVVQAVTEGKLESPNAGGGEEVNKTVIEELLKIIKNGSKDEARNALRKLNQYAKQGLISWSIYEEALKIYEERFGPPTILEGNHAERNEEEVNLTSILQGLQQIVVQAERARIEAQARGAPENTAHRLSLSAVSPPSALLLGLAGVGLFSVVLLAERERLSPIVDIARIIALRPGRSPEWCYSAIIQVFGLRGMPKSPVETPREYLLRVQSSLSPEALALLEDITRVYEASVYGAANPDFDPDECARRLRRVLIHGI